MKKSIAKLLIIGMLILGFSIPVKGNSLENQGTNTKGTVSFTGFYKPIGIPDPTPPSNEVPKPDETLPQTNDNGSSEFLLLGTFIISIVFLLWKRKNKQIQN